MTKSPHQTNNDNSIYTSPQHRPYTKTTINNHQTNSPQATNSYITNSPEQNGLADGGFFNNTDFTYHHNMDLYFVDMFHVDFVNEFLKSMKVQQLVPPANKDWSADEMTEIRQKLLQLMPNVVLGIREDIFSIKDNVNLEKSAFKSAERLKEAIFELSPIGSIVRPRMIFVKQIEFTDIVKSVLPRKYRNTMYCYLQSLPVHMDVTYQGNLQELIDINANFSDLSVGFYLKSTLLCEDLAQAINLVVHDKVLRTRRKVLFCLRDGFVVERDGIIKVAAAARDVPRCGIFMRKRKAGQLARDSST